MDKAQKTAVKSHRIVSKRQKVLAAEQHSRVTRTMTQVLVVLVFMVDIFTTACSFFS